MDSYQYILFIDTETSDKPRAWNSSTSETDKWPYILQVSWTICKKDGEHVATRDFYLNPGEIEINEDSQRIHGITLDFLQKNGIRRNEAYEVLTNDLLKYEPLIVGHFIKFDLRMLEVSFNRAQLPYQFNKFPRFCTMLNTKKPIGNIPLLRLGELYYSLFHRELKHAHNAKVDALATKDCFFKLVQMGKLNDKIIEKQQRHFRPQRGLKSMILHLLS